MEKLVATFTLRKTGQTMSAELETVEQEGCFICDDSYVFEKALIKMAENVGRKKAEAIIRENESPSSDPQLKFSETLGEKLKITGKLVYDSKAKKFSNAIGATNQYDFDSTMDVKMKIIPYKAKIYVKPKEDFHIYSVEITPSYKGMFSKDWSHILRYFNNKYILVAELFFKKEEDVLFVWKTFYEELMPKYRDSFLMNYDEKHNTNYYKMFKK